MHDFQQITTYILNTVWLQNSFATDVSGNEISHYSHLTSQYNQK